MNEKPRDPTFTEQEFFDAFRDQGFLSSFVEEAVPSYVRQHHEWFARAEALNRAGLEAFNRRENAMVGLSTHSPVALAMRMTYRALVAFQGALILYRRGMIAEGNTLTRSVYETAFWLGFMHVNPDRACRAFLNDEFRSQKQLIAYYLKQFEAGTYARNSEFEQQLKAQSACLTQNITKEKKLTLEQVATDGRLIDYFETYKKLSGGSVHNSLSSLHRYLRRNEDGAYDGFCIGPDLDGLVEAIPVLCIGVGVALTILRLIVASDHDEYDLLGQLHDLNFLTVVRRAARGGVVDLTLF